MNIETLIDKLVENGNKATLKGIEQTLEQATYEASCGNEVEAITRLINRMYPSKLLVIAKEIGAFYGAVTKDGYEAYYSAEDAINEEFMEFVDLKTNKPHLFLEKEADDIRAIYPQFFEAEEVEAE